jgi:hypothetical protein
MTDLFTELRHFTGTGEVFKHNLNRSFVYTEGVQYLAEKASAYWLIDYILSYQHLTEVRAEPFQTWKLEVKDNEGTMTLTDGNKRIIKTFNIPFTDFPLEKITLWLINKTLMLPSEY